MIWFDLLALKTKVWLQWRGQHLCIKCRTGLIAQPWRQPQNSEGFPCLILEKMRNTGPLPCSPENNPVLKGMGALTREPLFGRTERNEKSGERIV